MFRFENIYILFFLAVIPLFYLLFFLYSVQYKKRMREFAKMSTLRHLMPDYSSSKTLLKFHVLMFVFALLITSLARPQFGSKLKEVKRKGIEVIIALDVSNSMMATDISPNRLGRAKQAISTLVSKMKDDLIGMIIFAGEAYTQLPITTDYASAKMFLSNISPDAINRQGTAIGKAIKLARSSFTQNDETTKVIVIISDGENHEGDAIEEAKLANSEGINIYTIGMGSSKGSLIPLRNGSGFVSDKEGNPVTTQMNSDMLNQIAIAGNGKFYQASTTNVGLQKLYLELKKLDKGEIETKVYSEYDDQYSYLIALAIFLLIIDLFIFQRKNKWLGKVKLFG